MIKLSDKEKEVIYNLIGEMNYYEIMNILCRTYELEDLEENRSILLRCLKKFDPDDLD